MRRTLTLMVATLVAVSSGGVWAAEPAAPASIAIQLNWLPEPEFGGVYEAARAGIFARHGLQVTILKGGPDVPAVAMTAAGRVEFGVSAADEVVAMREKGGDVVALFATYQTSPQAIMVRADRKLRDIPSLIAAGGTLVAQPGLAYLKWLRHTYGFERMKIVPYGAGAMAQFLDPAQTSVTMQCFVFAEPLTARRNRVEPTVLPVAATGFDPYAGVIITRGDYLRSHREVCVRLVRALREGWRAYLDDPQPANREMARLNPAMDLATFGEAAAVQRPFVETAATRTVGLGAMDGARWQVLTRQLVEIGAVDTAIPAQDCFVNLN
jgi:NitT/TauT family transport system substrate-binding protein